MEIDYILASFQPCLQSKLGKYPGINCLWWPLQQFKGITSVLTENKTEMSRRVVDLHLEVYHFTKLPYFVFLYLLSQRHCERYEAGDQNVRQVHGKNRRERCNSL